VSAEENKIRFRRLFEEMFNKGNLAAADEAFTPNVVFHSPTEPEPVYGIEGFKRFPAMLRAGFPDIHITIEDLIAEDDIVMSRWSFRGTHRGPFLGIPPTGKQAAGRGMEVYRFVGDRIEEIWLEVDAVSMLQQIGILPPGGIPRPVLWLVGQVQRLRAHRSVA
jgi:steroid delta-isomerase-like uncharacterized protein